MLVIRPEQIVVFEKAALQNFENEMVQYIKQFTPKHSESIGDDVVHRVAQVGIERAKRYGLTNRGPVRFFIEMMFMFGSDFDSDPQYQWAADALRDQSTTDQMGRAWNLYSKTVDYFDEVVGPDAAHRLEALRRTRERLADPVAWSAQVPDTLLLSELAATYPQKWGYLGGAVFLALLEDTKRLVKAYCGRQDNFINPFLLLMFSLGHGFATDPLYPWAVRLLKDFSVRISDDLVARLRTQSVEWFDFLLSHN